jgi:quinolinate synthase
MFDTVIKQSPAKADLPMLEMTPAIAREAAPLYEKVKRVVNELDWATYAPYIVEINRLKKQMGAVVLAHNYMTPEIFHCVSDFAGDSLQLAQQAAKTDSQLIVQAGVHFMAETSKILSPQKTVLIPDMKAGCSLASSITAADVRLLRQKYPGVPIVTYVNTSADLKADSDI